MLGRAAVDAQGVVHLSDHQVHEGYILFKKEAPRPVLEALSKVPLDWTKLIVTLVDERWVDERVPPGHASTFGYTDPIYPVTGRVVA